MKTLLAFLAAASVLPMAALANGTNTPPVILHQPQSLSVREGEYASLEVVATGSEPLHYTWLKDATNVLYTTTPLLQFRLPTTNETGAYQVIITNDFGAVTSAVAQLDVRPYTPRELRVADFLVGGAGQVVLRIELAAQGNENQVSGSIRFSTDTILNPRLLSGPSSTSTTISVDTSMAGEGLFGLNVNWPPGASAPAGLINLAEVEFDLVPGASPISAALGWTNRPVTLAVTSSAGTNLLLEPVIVPVLIVPTNPPALDLQSGLFLQTLTLLNPGGDLNGVSILVTGLTNDTLGRPIMVQTAVTDSNGIPRLEYGPVLAGTALDLKVEYYVTDRRTVPTPTFEVQVRQPSWPLQDWSYVTLERCLYTNGIFLVEWQTGSNVLYYVQYRSDLSNTNAGWRTSLPPVVGTGRSVQWIDRGPPRTDSPPTGQDNRFYRVFWRR